MDANLMNATSVEVSSPSDIRLKKAEYLGPIQRAALEKYLIDSHDSPDLYIHETDKYILIRDKFPKSRVHCIMINRTEDTYMHPTIYLSNLEALATAREQVKIMMPYVVAECRREFEGIADPNRDWEKEIIVGTHSTPSCHNIHIHLFTPDMTGQKITSRSHYKAFRTDFTILLDQYPLPQVTPEMIAEIKELTRTTDRKMILPKNAIQLGLNRHYRLAEDADMECWRCKKVYTGEEWPALQEHLKVEFDAWIGEGFTPDPTAVRLTSP